MNEAIKAIDESLANGGAVVAIPATRNNLRALDIEADHDDNGEYFYGEGWTVRAAPLEASVWVGANAHHQLTDLNAKTAVKSCQILARLSQFVVESDSGVVFDGAWLQEEQARQFAASGGFRTVRRCAPYYYTPVGRASRVA
ncbi:MAG: hypothetical protein R3337_00150 [Gammaproteobacteria bacterium]|nr:hypothetical protein [Gammaproteobacteria bacterium]